MLHHPNAVPLPKGALPGAAEWAEENDLLTTTHHGFSPFGGLTSVHHGPGAHEMVERQLRAFLG